jgi:DNA repair exonuclease SbcCD ATPase subunit
MIDNQNELMSVSEYAHKHGVSVQSVYKRLKNKSGKEILKGHILEKGGVKYLDSFAVDYLETSGRGQSLVVSNFNDELENKNKEIEKLQSELYEKVKQLNEEKDKIILLAEELRKAEKKALQGENAILRLEAETDRAEQLKSQNRALEEQLEQVRAELNTQKAHLEAEQTRKLSFSERFRGRKKHID